MNTSHYSVYFAGELLSAIHLIGNSLIAQEILGLSGGQFRCLLPQDLESQDEDRDPQTIRDGDLTCLLGVI
jgi:hypothetical protein